MAGRRGSSQANKARREAFLAIALAEPERCLVVDATQSEQATAGAIWQAVAARFIDKAA